MADLRTLYAFGDSDLAARRLRLLSDTFAESSSSFMRESVRTQPQRAADLGCGPGFSTHLLATTLKPSHTVGLDNSENFLAYARKTANAKVSFHLHDITAGPFPCGPFDLIFSRFELTHLPEPEAAVMLWVSQLRPGGLLLIEEVECIDTADPAFLTYLDMQQEMLAHQRNTLFIGRRIDAITGSERLHRRASSARDVSVSGSRAAAMFEMNLGVWRHSDFVRERWQHATLDRLEQDIHLIANGNTDEPSIRWRLRQIVIEGT